MVAFSSWKQVMVLWYLPPSVCPGLVGSSPPLLASTAPGYLQNIKVLSALSDGGPHINGCAEKFQKKHGAGLKGT
jgi:hypothetical protein